MISFTQSEADYLKVKEHRWRAWVVLVVFLFSLGLFSFDALSQESGSSRFIPNNIFPIYSIVLTLLYSLLLASVFGAKLWVVFSERFGMGIKSVLATLSLPAFLVLVAFSAITFSIPALYTQSFGERGVLKEDVAYKRLSESRSSRRYGWCEARLELDRAKGPFFRYCIPDRTYAALPAGKLTIVTSNRTSLFGDFVEEVVGMKVMDPAANKSSNTDSEVAGS